MPGCHRRPADRQQPHRPPGMRDGTQPRFSKVRRRRASRIRRQARIQGSPGCADSDRPRSRHGPRIDGEPTGHRGLPAPRDGRAVRTQQDAEVQEGRLRGSPTRVAPVDDADRGTRRCDTTVARESQCGVGGAAEAGGGRDPAGTARPRRGSRRRRRVRVRRALLVPPAGRRDRLRRRRERLHRDADASARSGTRTAGAVRHNPTRRTHFSASPDSQHYSRRRSSS